MSKRDQQQRYVPLWSLAREQHPACISTAAHAHQTMPWMTLRHLSAGTSLEMSWICARHSGASGQGTAGQLPRAYGAFARVGSRAPPKVPQLLARTWIWK